MFNSSTAYPSSTTIPPWSVLPRPTDTAVPADGGPSGLSAGAIIGIIVGGILLLVALGWVVFMVGKRSAAVATGTTCPPEYPEISVVDDGPKPLPTGGTVMPQELGFNPAVRSPDLTAEAQAQGYQGSGEYTPTDGANRGSPGVTGYEINQGGGGYAFHGGDVNQGSDGFNVITGHEGYR